MTTAVNCKKTSIRLPKSDYLNSDAMQKASELLAFSANCYHVPILEFWWTDEKGSNCVYCHVEETMVSAYQDIITGYFPTVAHKTSPEVLYRYIDV